jgi:hypothetical protein
MVINANGTIDGLPQPVTSGNIISFGLYPDNPSDWGDNSGYCGFASAPATLQVLSDTSIPQKSSAIIDPVLTIGIFDWFNHSFVIPTTATFVLDFGLTTLSVDNKGSVTGVATSKLTKGAMNITFPALSVTALVGSTTSYQASGSFLIPGSTVTRSFTTYFSIDIGQCLTGEQPSSTGYGCEVCTIGSYSSYNNVTCATCSQGHFSNTTSSTYCFACSPGKYIGIPGSSACLDCIAVRICLCQCLCSKPISIYRL